MIALLALLLNRLFEKIKLPGLLGMLLLGIVISPYCLNLIDETILSVSKELRTFALIVILLRAGLGLKRDHLNKVGKSALLMSFIPGILEGLAIATLASALLGISFVEAGILGFIIAAVSPAVVVPQMLSLKENKYGEEKQIPTLILASASLDDIFAITIYGVFLSLYLGEDMNIGLQIAKVPISIILGIAIGAVLGLALCKLYKKVRIRDTKKIIILLAVCICFNAFGAYTDDFISSLLGIMTIGFILLEKLPVVANRLSQKMNKVWVVAEILLFVLIGAQVNINVALKAGLIGIILISVGLVFRSIGVLIALQGSDLNHKEKLFCVLSYLPKATVQAAIGAIPLAMGVESGEEILAIAVLAILVTAPIGSLAIRLSAPKLLKNEKST
jgi:NhaP-type Na+/H+ or K+/H+ antiporter